MTVGCGTRCWHVTSTNSFVLLERNSAIAMFSVYLRIAVLNSVIKPELKIFRIPGQINKNELRRSTIHTRHVCKRYTIEIKINYCCSRRHQKCNGLGIFTTKISNSRTLHYKRDAKLSDSCV